jgi:hypothetical protein
MDQPNIQPAEIDPYEMPRFHAHLQITCALLAAGNDLAWSVSQAEIVLGELEQASRNFEAHCRER